MEIIENFDKPTKAEQMLAGLSYDPLVSAIGQLKSNETEIEIEETGEKIKLPILALKLLAEILKSMRDGQPISIVPVAAEVTTQKAAEILGCSRPHLVKLLEEGKIEFRKVGKHRRIKMENVLKYRNELKEAQKEKLIEMMKRDEELGLYDS